MPLGYRRRCRGLGDLQLRVRSDRACQECLQIGIVLVLVGTSIGSFDDRHTEVASARDADDCVHVWRHAAVFGPTGEQLDVDPARPKTAGVPGCCTTGLLTEILLLGLSPFKNASLRATEHADASAPSPPRALHLRTRRRHACRGEPPARGGWPRDTAEPTRP